MRVVFPRGELSVTREITWDVHAPELQMQRRTTDGASPSPSPSHASEIPTTAGQTFIYLGRVKEFREMWRFRAQGKNGRDDPLTPEQELRAVGRRSER